MPSLRLFAPIDHAAAVRAYGIVLREACRRHDFSGSMGGNLSLEEAFAKDSRGFNVADLGHILEQAFRLS